MAKSFLANEDELNAYYLEDPAHPRAAAILWPLLIEKRIDKLFDLTLRRDDKVKNELLRPSGALGSYGAKVQLAYLLGWMGKEMYDDLMTIAKIRNRFAHLLEVKDFSDEKISAWLHNLRGSKVLPGMLEMAKKAVAEEKEVPTPDGASKKGRLYTLEGMAEDPQSRFRWCIDLMVVQLDKYAENMRRNLESLPASWLIGEDKPEQFRKPEASPEKS